MFRLLCFQRLFSFRSFVQVLYVCIHVVSMLLRTSLFNKDLESDKKPHMYRMVSHISPSSPSSSVVLVRSNRRRSPRQHKAHISTPISIHTNRRIRSRRKVGIRRRQALVMEFRPLLIALAPPNFDQDAGPKLTEAHIFPGAEGNPKPIPP